jgi:hypothetical protein
MPQPARVHSLSVVLTPVLTPVPPRTPPYPKPQEAAMKALVDQGTGQRGWDTIADRPPAARASGGREPHGAVPA